MTTRVEAATVGRMIADMRRVGLSLQAIGERLGVHRNRVWQLANHAEYGHTNVNIDTAVRVRTVWHDVMLAEDDTSWDGAADASSWRDDAACVDSVDPDVWFPIVTQGEQRSWAYTKARRALRICGACPVREACLDEALTIPPAQDHGVRGGTIEQDRRLIRTGELSTDKAVTRAVQQVTAAGDPSRGDLLTISESSPHPQAVPHHSPDGSEVVSLST